MHVPEGCARLLSNDGLLARVGFVVVQQLRVLGDPSLRWQTRCMAMELCMMGYE